MRRLKTLDPFRGFMIVVAAAFIWSAIRPADRWVWFFELSLGLVAVAVLAATHRRFPMSGLVYLLAAIHFVILACGAKYTYAEMPLFNLLRDMFHLARNNFDRVGHFAQGFVPAIVVREILRRVTGMRPGRMLGFLCVCVCLAFSASYEIFEWLVVIKFYPASGPEWLGMQGDPWDAQEDMLQALLGATIAILTLSRLHERSMAAAVTQGKDPDASVR
jgi:putative membrane protein